MPRFPVCVLLCLSATANAQPAPKAPEPKLVEGRFGKALDASISPLAFTGDSRYRTPPITVECWAKLSSKREFNVVVANDVKSSPDHWELYSYAGSGVLSAYFPGYEPSEVKSRKNVCDKSWHHLAMTFDGKTVTLFADGREVHRQDVKRRPAKKTDVGPFMIGMAQEGTLRVGCDGLVDEVRVSRIVRTIALPTAAPAVDADTVGVWRFDDTTAVLADPAWTPPPGTSGEAWQKMTDVDWIDARLRKMDTGPAFNGTLSYTHDGKRVNVPKGTAIRLGDGEGGVMFDRATMRFAAAWTGGYLHHSDRRFGLLNTPTPVGPTVFSEPQAKEATIPVPRDKGRYEGLTLHGNRVVLRYTQGGAAVKESPSLVAVAGAKVVTRTLEVGPSDTRLAFAVPEKLVPTISADKRRIVAVGGPADRTQLVVADSPAFALKRNRPGPADEFELPPSKETRRVRFLYLTAPKKTIDAVVAALDAMPPAEDVSALCKPAGTRWGEPLVTRGEASKDETSPYVVDTLTIPYDNPHRALFFCTGLDFLPDGRIAVCTCHGDVWLVKADKDLSRVEWRRFATGLYHPLGLKVVAGVVTVLERGQLTRLHDDNADGEADRYENLCHDWHTGTGEHSYDTCLETDSKGNFYFFKTGDGHLPHGGCLMKASPDGRTVSVHATGFRHPIGMSVSPDDFVTGADQEGNWMPVTRVDMYKPGGFYGDMRTHHRATAPTIYDPPLVWLPKDVDNSAGGQAWVPHDRFGLPKGQLLHLSYGRCSLMALLTQKVGDVTQAGAVDLGVRFLSGSCRARFHPSDSSLYVSGLNGWQTAAKRDGSLQRVRYTGRPLSRPVGLEVVKDGIRLRFPEPLAKGLKASAFTVEQWNYRWSGDYGSKKWSPSRKDTQGIDAVPVESVTLSDDGREVFLHVRGLTPVMQMKISYDLKAAAGAAVRGVIHNTVHALAEAAKKE